MSVADYKEFTDWAFDNGGGRCEDSPTAKDHRPAIPASRSNEVDYLNHPVVGVDWYDAMCYCRWEGKRLPLWSEWEAAVGGDQGWNYPWGNTYQGSRVNDSNQSPDVYKYTMPVNSLPEGATQLGVYHMVGNVSEWIYDGPDGVPDLGYV